MKATLKLEAHKLIDELTDQSEKIAYSNLPPEQKIAELKELQASCPERLIAIPESYIVVIKDDIRNGA